MRSLPSPPHHPLTAARAFAQGSDPVSTLFQRGISSTDKVGPQNGTPVISGIQKCLESNTRGLFMPFQQQTLKRRFRSAGVHPEHTPHPAPSQLPPQLLLV